jgi:hypothetical protein
LLLVNLAYEECNDSSGKASNAADAAFIVNATETGGVLYSSITATSGRCGKATCRCHRPREPPHGPTDRLTYKVKGKTVSESLPNPAALAKAEREVAVFRN